MMTESKLRGALDRLDRKLAGGSRDRPMSGLSIPAEYYLRRKAAKSGAASFSRKTRVRTTAAAK